MRRDACDLVGEKSTVCDPNVSCLGHDIQRVLNIILAITMSAPFTSAQIRTASRRHRSDRTPSVPASPATARSMSNELVHDPRACSARTPSDGVVGKFTSAVP